LVSVSLAIPVLNEAKTLEEQIEKLLAFFRQHPGVFDETIVTIADNGSTDGTQSIGRRLALTIPQVRYVRLDAAGVGKALRKTWAEHPAEIFGYMDLDLSTSLIHLLEVIKAFESGAADLVMGTRWHKKSRVRGRRLIRSVSSFLFNFTLRRCFSIPITDAMCGFKFVSKSALQKLLAEGASNDRWFFGAELAIIGRLTRMRVIELPVEWTDDAESKVKLLPLTIEYLIAIKSLKRRLS